MKKRKLLLGLLVWSMSLFCGNFRHTYNALILKAVGRKMPVLMDYFKKNPEDIKSQHFARFMLYVIQECSLTKENHTVTIGESQDVEEVSIPNTNRIEADVDAAFKNSEKENWLEYLKELEVQIKQERKLLRSSY